MYAFANCEYSHIRTKIKMIGLGLKINKKIKLTTKHNKIRASKLKKVRKK